MPKFNPTNFDWTVESNCSCELPLICIRPIKFRNPVLCINSAIDVNNFENFLKKSPNEQQISPSPQNFENCSTEQTIFNTITTTPEYNSTTTTPQSFIQHNFSFWLIYTLLGLILALQVFVVNLLHKKYL
ncbi:unnamed protein product [Meloidogyne enterolobii]|uniref:Uncharacterized protein n=1 Tax=Meloidogyne enterolobii TaxID=390850 RepID=A0ACB0XZV8_MELEN